MTWVFGAIEELLPVIVFFIVQTYWSFQVAIAAMIVSLVLLLVYAFGVGKMIPRFAVFSTVAFLLFAIPSLVTKNNAYFQISDTIIDGTFALLLLGSWMFGIPLLKYFFGSIFAITDKGWQVLSLRWGVLFLLLALLNEFIRQLYSEDLWSLYKLLSTISILLFGLYQFTLSRRERLKGESNRLGLRIKSIN